MMKIVFSLTCYIILVVNGLKYEDIGKLLIRNFRSENISWKYGMHEEFYGLDENEFEKYAGLNLDDDDKQQLPTKRHGRSVQDLIIRPQIGRLYIKRYPLPKTFDWRSYTKCQSIFDVRYQGACGACWAVTSAAVMSDRYCLWTNISRIFSAWDVATCMSDNPNIVCSGNTARNAFQYYISQGVVSGGDPKIKRQPRGCIPYPKNLVEVKSSLKCPRDCTTHDGINYDRDTKFGTDLKIISGVDAIQREIYENGSVLAGFKLYSDFMYYKSGVYYKSSTSTLIGGHAVRLIGWGVEKGYPYWLGINNWGSEWGEKGYFKFLRGANHCGIEAKVVLTMPMEAFE